MARPKQAQSTTGIPLAEQGGLGLDVPAANGKKASGANLGFEATLWAAADKMRGHMDPSEYKHVALGLIFLKYISDAFAERHARLVAEQAEGADPEDPDEYRMENVFWVPPEARWEHLQAHAKQPAIGTLIDAAMEQIERSNSSLRGVLPKDYGRPALDKQRLGELIDLIGRVSLGGTANRSKDILGRVYEYFLSQFASAEGKKGGEFYTPQSVVRVLSRCSRLTRGVFSIPAAARAACSCRARSSLKSTAGGSATSASMARSRTRRPGGWPR